MTKHKQDVKFTLIVFAAWETMFNLVYHKIKPSTHKQHSKNSSNINVPVAMFMFYPGVSTVSVKLLKCPSTSVLFMWVIWGHVIMSKTNFRPVNLMPFSINQWIQSCWWKNKHFFKLLISVDERNSSTFYTITSFMNDSHIIIRPFQPYTCRRSTRWWWAWSVACAAVMMCYCVSTYYNKATLLHRYSKNCCSVVTVLVRPSAWIVWSFFSIHGDEPPIN